MNQFLIGEKCVECHNKFLDGDDVVVCPICGAPYHRVCYNHAGECIFKDRHGEYEWQSEQDALMEHCDNMEKVNVEAEQAAAEGMPFPSDNDATFDPDSFADSYIKSIYEDFSKLKKEFQPVDEVNGEDVAAYLGHYGTFYYMRHFVKFSKKQGSILAPNFATFFLFPLHCFYRHMNFLGTICTILFMAIPEIIMILGQNLVNNGFSADTMLVLGSLICLIIELFMLMFFNYLYFRSSIKKIRIIKEENASLSLEQQRALMHEAGKPSKINAVAFTIMVTTFGLIIIQLLNSYIFTNTITL